MAKPRRYFKDLPLRQCRALVAPGYIRPIFLTFFVSTLFAADFPQRSDAWFRTEEGKAITRNVLSWQTKNGDWPKNTDTTKPSDGKDRTGTFDNGATTGELRFLAQAFKATADEKVKASFGKGLDHVLKAQYPIGGWPQTYPPGNGYNRHVTFNDNAMVRLMQFMRDVAHSENFDFVAAEKRGAAQAAFDRGVECILKSQVKVDEILTVWCAQHDEKTLEPRSARSYELVSLSGSESAGLLNLLMSLDKPSPEIVRAVDSGVAWFEKVKLNGIRQTRVEGDKKIVADPNAPPLWARFYEIGTNRPFFCGRDGVKKYSIGEIEAERRNGYAWYGEWGKDLPARHAAWKAKLK